MRYAHTVGMSYQPSDIIDLRKRLSLSQEELAAELGVHRSNVSRWETGDTRPGGAVRKLLDGLAARQIPQGAELTS